MKMHLMIMTAMLSFGITHNCESSVKAKDNGEACEKAFHCKSNVCKDKKCEPGKEKAGKLVIYPEECASQQVSCKPDETFWAEELKKEKEGGATVCDLIKKKRADWEWFEPDEGKERRTYGQLTKATPTEGGVRLWDEGDVRGLNCS